MLDETIVTECRRKIAEVANKSATITYSELAGHLHVANQSVGKYLTEIYKRECEGTANPDLTTVVVYADTGYGRYNSEGEEAESVRVDPDNAEDVRRYKDMLRRVHARKW